MQTNWWKIWETFLSFGRLFAHCVFRESQSILRVSILFRSQFEVLNVLKSARLLRCYCLFQLFFWSNLSRTLGRCTCNLYHLFLHLRSHHYIDRTRRPVSVAKESYLMILSMTLCQNIQAQLMIDRDTSGAHCTDLPVSRLFKTSFGSYLDSDFPKDLSSQQMSMGKKLVWWPGKLLRRVGTEDTRGHSGDQHIGYCSTMGPVIGGFSTSQRLSWCGVDRLSFALLFLYRSVWLMKSYIPECDSWKGNVLWWGGDVTYRARVMGISETREIIEHTWGFEPLTTGYLRLLASSQHLYVR